MRMKEPETKLQEQLKAAQGKEKELQACSLPLLQQREREHELHKELVQAWGCTDKLLGRICCGSRRLVLMQLTLLIKRLN